jgi:D-psicose/D-tagatose/L-ribulose 3-epimerase
MKIGLHLLLWTPAATEDHIPLLDKAKGWGADGVEFPMFDLAASNWPALGAACDERGLDRTVSAVLPEGANLIGEDADERAAAIDFLKGCVDACGELGAEAMVGPFCSPVGQLVGRGPTDAERAWAAEGLRTVGEHASGTGLRLSLEALNRFETYYPNCQADMAALIDEVGVDCVGQMYDTFHANIEEKDLIEAIKTGGHRINHVHISANDRATPGEDHIDYGATKAGLEAIGYDGWFVIEAFGQALPELAGATCIWRTMAPSEEHIAENGLRFVREFFLS